MFSLKVLTSRWQNRIKKGNSGITKKNTTETGQRIPEAKVPGRQKVLNKFIPYTAQHQKDQYRVQKVVAMLGNKCQMPQQGKYERHQQVHLTVPPQEIFNTSPDSVAVTKAFTGRKSDQKRQPGDSKKSVSHSWPFF